ncbi:MAG: helix-turn-helix domain-containing protein [Rhizobiaceae bacterium]|nr:helix-turn-helix domain-containing protein [Rhizobiaceae bacterium]
MEQRNPEIEAESLIGVGLYTPDEAARLLRIPSRKIVRWLRGHEIGGRWYDPLWKPQIQLGDGKIYLGFRDLMELRTADAFMQAGVSAILIRRAILEAQKFIDEERPLSTTKFMTDGRSVFLEIADDSGDTKLLDLFNKQYAFKRIIEASLKGVDFEGIAPVRWWPHSRSQRIVLDPEKSFGQPIDSESGVPTAALSAAAKAEGSPEAAARAWQVPVQSVLRAVKFETELAEAA